MNRRTQLTIKTHSVTIIKVRGGKSVNTAFCENCGTHAPSFRYEHAALIQTNAAEIERLSQLEQIHRVANGDLCGNSLAARFGREIRLIED